MVVVEEAGQALDLRMTNPHWLLLTKRMKTQMILMLMEEVGVVVVRSNNFVEVGEALHIHPTVLGAVEPFLEVGVAVVLIPSVVVVLLGEEADSNPLRLGPFRIYPPMAVEHFDA